jgi:hypothetical protein
MVLLHAISANFQLEQMNQRVTEDSYNSRKFISKTCLRFILASTLYFVLFSISTSYLDG